jgi:hypothetical protein
MTAGFCWCIRRMACSPPGLLRRGRTWRDAAATVADLPWAPAIDTGRDVAGELREVLHWLRAQHDQGETADRRRALHRGLDRALHRRATSSCTKPCCRSRPGR